MNSNMKDLYNKIAKDFFLNVSVIDQIFIFKSQCQITHSDLSCRSCLAVLQFIF